MLSPSGHRPSGHPSDWVQRWAELLPRGARVLDVACGAGRHVRFLAEQGCHITALDRDANALADLRELPGVTRTIVADIENAPWPLIGETFDAVLVTNYLWRPLTDTVLKSVAPGGVLIYETFAHGNASVGRPARPDFLLQPGELMGWVAGSFRVIAYEDGFLSAPERFVQRIVAIRETPGATPSDPPVRHALDGHRSSRAGE